jgi:protein ImuB
MVICVHFPRFALTAAAGGAAALAGRPLALAPERARAGLRVGEVSGAAEAHGVGAGMPLSEALARCPDLELLPSDPLAVEELWEDVLAALEGIGASVEPARPGLAYFEAAGLNALHGSQRGTLVAAWRAARSALEGRPPRIGAGATRFIALAAALGATPRRPKVLEDDYALRYLSGQPVDLLGLRPQTKALVEPLIRLGVRTLGEALALGRDAMADRFGEEGILAHKLAGGHDDPLTPRALEARLVESMEVGDVSSGEVLQRTLAVLVDRLLARPERRGRALRVLGLSARLLGGGSWHERVALRQALADPKRIGLALSLRLTMLPAPAEELRLGVERFGPVAGEQRTLADHEGAARRERLGEAVGHLRAVAGPEAALRAVCVDPDSRVPERRVVLAPLPG